MALIVLTIYVDLKTGESNVDTKLATYIGLDVSTTALTVVIRDAEGNEDWLALPMEGATTWHGAPAFDNNYLPYMLLTAIIQLEERGWLFTTPGILVAAVRQHDLVFTNQAGQLLMPALSWQCDKARTESKLCNPSRIPCCTSGDRLSPPSSTQ